MDNRKLISGFVNGCFDALHAGHVLLLQKAANCCDHLTIAINSDDYCKRAKGPNRPLQRLHARVSALRQVCRRLPCKVILRAFDESTPALLLSEIKPDVYVLGSDYRDKTPLPGREFCGQVIFVERLPGYSTSASAPNL